MIVFFKVELDVRLQGDLVIIRVGSDFVFDVVVGGKFEFKIIWIKGDKELDFCEKIFLQYIGKRVIVVIKFCDRSDSGKYILIVKNVSGIKVVFVLVKVFGEYVKCFFIFLVFLSVGRKKDFYYCLLFFVLDFFGLCGKFIVSRVIEEKCILVWSFFQEDGGVEIIYYIVERREISRFNWVIVEGECLILFYVVIRFIKNNEYIFRVRVVNKYGFGVFVELESIVVRNLFSEY